MSGRIVRLVFMCDQSSCASVLSDVELGLVLGLGLGWATCHGAAGGVLVRAWPFTFSCDIVDSVTDVKCGIRSIQRGHQILSSHGDLQGLTLSGSSEILCTRKSPAIRSSTSVRLVVQRKEWGSPCGGCVT